MLLKRIVSRGIHVDPRMVREVDRVSGIPSDG